jgi:hypothetical protein
VTSDCGGRPFTAASVDSPLPGDDEVLRDARIRDLSQAVFSASQLGALVGYIRECPAWQRRASTQDTA